MLQILSGLVYNIFTVPTKKQTLRPGDPSALSLQIPGMSVHTPGAFMDLDIVTSLTWPIFEATPDDIEWPDTDPEFEARETQPILIPNL